MAVGHHKELRLHRHIVPRDLIENRLGDFDLRCFAFHEYVYRTVIIENDHVISFGQSVDCEQFFDIDQRFRVFHFVQQKMDDMLAHPFFGRQDNKFAPDFIKYGNGIAGISEPKSIGFEIELLHAAKKQKMFKMKYAAG